VTSGGLLEPLVERLLSLRRARAYATVAIALFTLVYALGIATRRGLVDGFGHVIGGDLLSFRTAAEIVREGDGRRLYDFALQATHQQAAIAPEPLRGVIPFVSPPFVALAWLPWARLPHVPAFILWTAVGLACLPVAFLLICDSASRNAEHCRDGVLLALSFTPILEGLAAGSNALLSLPIFAATFVAFRARRETLAGALLGLQLFRPQLLLAPLVLLAWKRRWRALAGFVAVALMLAGLAVLFVDPHSLLAWLSLLPLLSRMMFEPGMPTPIFSSVHALFLLPLGERHLGLGLAAGMAAAVLILAALLALWSGPWRPEADDFGLRFAALVVVTPLVSQYLQLHDFAILILAAVLVVEETLRRPAPSCASGVRLVLAVVWVTCMVAPAVSARLVPVPLAPLGALLLAWWVARAARAARTDAGA
jgi:hypothetical protein